MKIPDFIRKIMIRRFGVRSTEDKTFVIYNLMKEMQARKAARPELYDLEVKYGTSEFYTCVVVEAMFGKKARDWLFSVWLKHLGDSHGQVFFKNQWRAFTGIDSPTVDLKICALHRVLGMIESGELQ